TAYASRFRWQVVTFTDGTTIQTGEDTFPNNLTLAPALPTPVDPTRSWLYFTVRCNGSGMSYSNVRGQIQSSDVLEFERYNTSTTVNPTVRWYVVEFPSGKGATVQRGLPTTTATTDLILNDTLTPSIDKTQTFLYHSSRGNGNGNAYARPYWINRFTTCTGDDCSGVQFQRWYNGQHGGIAWEAVTMPTCANPGTPSSPSPPDDATGISVDADLDWDDSLNATAYDVYFDTVNPPVTQVASDITSSNHTLPTLSYNTQYFWKIVAKNACDTTDGPVWDLTTCPPAPGTPGTPSPVNGATGVSVDADLDWADCSDTDSYDVYFSTSSTPPLVGNTAVSSYALGTLLYETTYYWKIVAKNDCGNTAATVWSFTTESCPPAPGTPSTPSPVNGATGVSIDADLDWDDSANATSYDVYFGPSFTNWLSGWDNRIPLTIDHNDIDSNVSDFPLLVYLSTSSGRNNDDVSAVFDELLSDANRKKIAVTTSDGTTQCYVEIEKWDHATEQAWLWVKVPSISSGADTDLCLYYDVDQPDNTTYVGDTGSTPAQNVWDSNFAMVQHLHEAPANGVTGHIDSTSNPNDGTPQNFDGTPTSTTDGTGKVDGADVFDGVDDTVEITDDNTLDVTNITVAAWIKRSTIGVSQGILAKESQYKLGISQDKLLGAFDNGTWQWCDNLSTGTISQDTWTHVAITYDNNGYIYYIDGQASGSGTDITGSLNTGGTNSVGIGRYDSSGNKYMDGTIDEVRISNSARPAAWIKASYESGRDDLLDFGSTNPTPPFVGNTADSSYALGTLLYDRTYHWQIVAKNGCGNTPGPVWSFTTTSNNVPTLDWTGDTGYTNEGVEPNTGTSGSSFEFRVEYTDADGLAPTTKEVWIDLNDDNDYDDPGEKVAMAWLSGSDYTLGVDFNASFPILYAGDGTLKYRFYFRDIQDDATGNPALDNFWYLTVTPNNAPTLDWTGDTGYTTDGVEPDVSVRCSAFEFRVTYTDADNHPPTVKQVWIDLDDSGAYQEEEKFNMTKRSGEGDDYTAGVKYDYSSQISFAGDGQLNYRFYFTDGQDDATGGPTADQTLTIIYSTGCNGQVWAKTYGGTDNDSIYAVQQTQDGGFVMAGDSRSFGTDTDIWVVKFDCDGTVDWERHYGKVGDTDFTYSIDQTQDGGYIVAGTKNTPWEYYHDFWLLRLNADGTIAWQKSYGGIEGNEDAYSVQQTADNGYIVAGYTGSFGAGSSDLWIVKLQPDGSIEWEKTYGGSGMNAKIQQTIDGGYVVLAQDAGMWVLKLNPNGTIAWQKKYPGGWCKAIDQTFDAWGNFTGYILAGYTSNGAGGNDAWILKLNSDGTIAWQKAYGGTKNDWAISVKQTHDSGYVVAGWNYSNRPTFSLPDAWVFKLNSSGGILWETIYFGDHQQVANSLLPDTPRLLAPVAETLFY
ncbi:MAG: DUF2341 domain-containing protein, partial [Deltaproteobacteria bacterium]|nr:DUF2341 domain-containing protein [Deltaproteobacteria bacterium]